MKILFLPVAISGMIAGLHYFTKNLQYEYFHGPRDLSNRKVMLILKGGHDYNHALKLTDYLRTVFERLEESGYDIVIQKVSTIEDFSKAIKQLHQQNNTIKVLWILAHGNATAIKLDEDDIDQSTVGNLKECLALLAADSTIVLRSCRVGSPKEKNNIAQQIARIAPNSIVYAPTISTFHFTEIRILQYCPLAIRFFNRPDPYTCEDITRILHFNSCRE